MRKFSSYGPVDKDLHFYVPREELIQKACHQLIGENPDKGGHYITVWAPRQRGKTWILNNALWRLKEDKRFHVLKLELEVLKQTNKMEDVLSYISGHMIRYLNIESPEVVDLKNFEGLFHRRHLKKPLILILDEFDALFEEAISGIAGSFRNIYNFRQKESVPSAEKEYLLHGVALIGVRSVLGIENQRGSPFNVQRSLHVPNLTYDEVDYMFKWYERESGQKVKQDVIDRLFYETQGQPGLVSWFGELLTEGYQFYQPDLSKPITPEIFDQVYYHAVNALPNNNILNIISKAKQESYKPLVLELFKTREKVEFKFDEERFNFLYMNGVIDVETEGGKLYVKFPCPFVQKRLFNYFSTELFQYMGQIFEPFEDVSDTITKTYLNVKNLIHRYEKYLQKNRDWMLKDAPRHSDLRIYEAVFHFNLYEYLVRFFGSYKQSLVLPEFPTGNGKVDILIKHGGMLYALELKSYKDEPAYQDALEQAAHYAASLKLNRIYLIVFVEHIPDEYRATYEVDYLDQDTGVTVTPVFVAIGK